MSNQSSWNQGRQDSGSGKGPSSQTGRTWQEKQSYDAGYNSGKGSGGSGGSGGTGGNK
jgi:hypothetical protein